MKSPKGNQEGLTAEDSEASAGDETPAEAPAAAALAWPLDDPEADATEAAGVETDGTETDAAEADDAEGIGGTLVWSTTWWFRQ